MDENQYVGHINQQQYIDHNIYSAYFNTRNTHKLPNYTNTDNVNDLYQNNPIVQNNPIIQSEPDHYMMLTLKYTKQPTQYEVAVSFGAESNALFDHHDHVETEFNSEMMNHSNQSSSPKSNLQKRNKLSNHSNIASNSSSNATSNNVPQCTEFYGTCYNCGYKAHSQNWCPLRQCNQCHGWGHASKVCPSHAKKNWNETRISRSNSEK